MAYCRDIPMLLADSKLNENRRSNGQTLIVYDRGFFAYPDTRPDEEGSPSPIVQIQEQHILGLKSRDEHFIIHHLPAPSRIQDYRNRKYPRKTGHYCTICAEDGDVYKLWNALSPLPQQLHALDAGYANRTETRLANDSSAAISLSQCAMQAENFC